MAAALEDVERRSVDSSERNDSARNSAGQCDERPRPNRTRRYQLSQRSLVKAIGEDQAEVEIDQQIEIGHRIGIARRDAERAETHPVVTLDQLGKRDIDGVVVTASLTWLVQHRDFACGERTQMNGMVVQLITQTARAQPDAIDVVALIVAIEHQTRARGQQICGAILMDILC